MVIFCCTQVEAATRRGIMNRYGSGLVDRSKPKNSLFKAVSYTHLTLPTNREV